MKNIVVIVAASGKHHDLQIEAGTTADDVLGQIGLSEYVLSKDNGHHTFGGSENIYPEVEDGEKLHVASQTDVGSKSLNVARC